MTTTLSDHQRSFYSLFSVLWAVHVLFHYSSYASFFVSPLGLAAWSSAVVLLLRPSSPVRMIASCYFYALAWFSHLPNAPNHEMLGSFCALTVATALALARLREGPAFSAPRALWNAAPVLRSAVILMYFWATFHKLNDDFLFNERASCGSVFYDSFLDRFPFLPPADGVLNLVLAWGTVGIEAAIGILLLFRRTRGWGFALGWGVHLFLTLSPESGSYNFTSLLFALFLLFGPASLASDLGKIWRESRLYRWALSVLDSDRWRALPTVLLSTASVILSLALVTHHSISRLGDDLFEFFLDRHLWIRAEAFKPWIVWSLALSYFVWRAYRTSLGGRFVRAPGAWASSPKVLWIFPLVLLFWGATPYLGLKTESSLAMFSNLRTETAPNHFLVPKGLQVFGYQDDVVQIVSVVGRRADGGRLPGKLVRSGGFSIPYEGLRGWIRTELRYGSRIEEVTYRRNGQQFVERFDRGDALFQQSMLAHKWLQFRRFRPKGPMPCEH